MEYFVRHHENTKTTYMHPPATAKQFEKSKASHDPDEREKMGGLAYHPCLAAIHNTVLRFFPRTETTGEHEI